MNATQYKYLGIEIYSTRNMNNFEKCFKHASSRVLLLAKIRGFLDLVSAKAVYD